jgi:hypothetical protein
MRVELWWRTPVLNKVPSPKCRCRVVQLNHLDGNE